MPTSNVETAPNPNQRPRPAPIACDTAIAEIGSDKVWVGRYAISRPDDWYDHRIRNHSFVACFRSERDCENWRYWIQGYYDRVSQFYQNSCVQGWPGFAKR